MEKPLAAKTIVTSAPAFVTEQDATSALPLRHGYNRATSSIEFLMPERAMIYLHRAWVVFGTLLTVAALAQEPAPAPAAKDKPKQTNRLAKETSPYLLQHAHNPVDWHPW